MTGVRQGWPHRELHSAHRKLGAEAPRALRGSLLPWPSGSHSPFHGSTDRAPSGTLRVLSRQAASTQGYSEHQEYVGDEE